MPQVINNLGGRYTCKQTHMHMHTHKEVVDKSNFKKPGAYRTTAGMPDFKPAIIFFNFTLS